MHIHHKDFRIFCYFHADKERLVIHAGIGFGKDFPAVGLSQDGPVSPDVIVGDVDAAFEDKTDCVDLVTGTVNVAAFSKWRVTAPKQVRADLISSVRKVRKKGVFAKNAKSMVSPLLLLKQRN